ncbi:MAG: BamA/TamA family outer membrane protein [Bacteroidota bacterium]
MKNSILFFCLFTFFAFGQSLSAQEEGNFIKRYFNKVLNDTVAKEKSQFFMYPTLGYQPETSLEIGFSPLYVYYANEDPSNRLSEINGFAFFTLEQQYGANFSHAIYSDQDEWFFLGDVEFQRFPLQYYGIGNGVPQDHIALVDAMQFMFKERVLRKVANNFFIGLEADFRSFSRVDFEPAEGEELDFELPFGAEGTTNLGLGVGLVYDERHNVLNVRDGFFSELAYLNFNPFWSSQVKYQYITTDTRYYKSVGKNNVIAAQLLGEFNFDGKIPFNQLSLMGGQNMMRGYFLGRFRDRNQISTQVEFRMLPLNLGFTNRWGATVFASGGNVFDEFSNLKSSNFKWAAGAGIRFLLFREKDIYARLDYAYTPDENGFYITIGEAF